MRSQKGRRLGTAPGFSSEVHTCALACAYTHREKHKLLHTMVKNIRNHRKKIRSLSLVNAK